jgi:phage-related protein
VAHFLLDTMSPTTYNGNMTANRKPLVWLHGKLKTPPMSPGARVEAGYLLGLVQEGVKLAMPQSRPMPEVGNQCHELRVTGEHIEWRIIYRVDDRAVPVVDIFEKKTRATPKRIIEACKRRLAAYDGR